MTIQTNLTPKPNLIKQLSNTVMTFQNKLANTTQKVKLPAQKPREKTITRIRRKELMAKRLREQQRNYINSIAPDNEQTSSLERDTWDMSYSLTNWLIPRLELYIEINNKEHCLDDPDTQLISTQLQTAINLLNEDQTDRALNLLAPIISKLWW